MNHIALKVCGYELTHFVYVRYQQIFRILNLKYEKGTEVTMTGIQDIKNTPRTKNGQYHSHEIPA